MKSVADSMLKRGLELHARGMGLEMALQVSTADHVQRAFRMHLPWARDWATTLHMRWGTFEDCFRWAFASAATPSLAPFSQAVQKTLLSEPVPARAVRAAAVRAGRDSASADHVAARRPDRGLR